jgi:hypothetical protein
MRLALALAFALLPGKGLQEPVEIGFHPAQGARLAKSFTLESEGRISALTLNGGDITSMLRGLDAISVESRLGVIDELVEVGGGRPLELVRDFEQVETTWGWRSRNSMLHPLLSRSVRFLWDPKHGAYDKEWVPRRGSVRPLDGVWEDLDYRCLLPEEPVAVGAKWYVSFLHIAPALLPGGSIHRNEMLWDEWSLFDLEDALAPFELALECEAELELRSDWTTLEVEAVGDAVWRAEARVLE